MAMDRIYTTAPQLHNQRVELRPPKPAAIEDAGRLEETQLLDTGPNSQLYQSLSISSIPMFPEFETMGFMAEVQEVKKAERVLSNGLGTFRLPQSRPCNEVNIMGDMEMALQKPATKNCSERSESVTPDAGSTSAISERSYIHRAVNVLPQISYIGRRYAMECL